jgi:hypothetical protein
MTDLLVRPTLDRVRSHTDPAVLGRLDRQMENSIWAHVALGPEAIKSRLDQLESEWDIESVLELNAAAFAGAGVIASTITKDRRWLLLTGSVLGFLAQHATQGWCPPLAVFRRMGIRTAHEIEAERMALLTALGALDVYRVDAAKADQ